VANSKAKTVAIFLFLVFGALVFINSVVKVGSDETTKIFLNLIIESRQSGPSW
jgi:hypothetical protein